MTRSELIWIRISYFLFSAKFPPLSSFRQKDIITHYSERAKGRCSCAGVNSCFIYRRRRGSDIVKLLKHFQIKVNNYHRNNLIGTAHQWKNDSYWQFAYLRSKCRDMWFTSLDDVILRHRSDWLITRRHCEASLWLVDYLTSLPITFWLDGRQDESALVSIDNILLTKNIYLLTFVVEESHTKRLSQCSVT